MKKLFVTVLTPDDNYWVQEIQIIDNDKEKSIRAYKKTLGKGYRIVDSYTIE